MFSFFSDKCGIFVTSTKQLLGNPHLYHSSSRNHGDGGDCGHRCSGHHLPGILRGISGCVSSSLLPPSRPSTSLWFQVCTLVYTRECDPIFTLMTWLGSAIRKSLSHSLFSTNRPFFHLRPTVDLIGAMETQSEPSELELDDVVITNPHIEAMLENEDWIEDASYWYFTLILTNIIMFNTIIVSNSTTNLSFFLFISQGPCVSLHCNSEGRHLF